MLSLITLPNPIYVVTSSAAWFTPFFGEFWAWGIVAVGIFLGFALIMFLYEIFMVGLDRLHEKMSPEYHYQNLRDEHIQHIINSNELDADWRIWRNAHK